MMTNNCIIPQNCVQNMTQQDFGYYTENIPVAEFQEMGDFESSDFPKEDYPSSSGVCTINPNDLVQKSRLNVDAKEFIPREHMSNPTMGLTFAMDAKEFVPREHMSNPNMGFTFVMEIPNKNVPYENVACYSELPVENQQFNINNWDKELLEDEYHNTNIGVEPSFDLNDTVAAPVLVPKINNIENTNDIIVAQTFAPEIGNESVDKTYIPESNNTTLEQYTAKNVDINGNRELHLNTTSVPNLQNVEKVEHISDIHTQLRYTESENYNKNNHNRNYENKSPKIEELPSNTSMQTRGDIEKVKYNIDKTDEHKSLQVKSNSFRHREYEKHNRNDRNRSYENKSSKSEELPLNASALQNLENVETVESNTDKNDGNRSRKSRFDRSNQPWHKEYDRNTRDYHNKSSDMENGKSEGGYYQQKNKFRYSQSHRSSPSGKFEDGGHRQRDTNVKKNEEGSFIHSKDESRAARRQTEGLDNQKKYKNENRSSSKGNSPNYRKNRSQDVPDKKGTSSVKQEVHPDTREFKPTHNRYDKRREESDAEHSNQDSDKEEPKRKWSERHSLGSDRSFENEHGRSKKTEKDGNTETTKKFTNRSMKHPKFKADDKKPERDTSKTTDIPQDSFNEAEFRREQERRSLDSNNATKHKTKPIVSFQDDPKENRPRRSLETNKSYRDRRADKEAEKSFRDALFSEKTNKPRDLKHERSTKQERSFQQEEFKTKRTDKWPWDEQNVVDLFDREHAEVDGEYKAFLKELDAQKTPESPKIVEQNQDLFQMSKEYCLAHCVAEDMRMGSGIAVNFRNTFKSVDYLLNMRQKPGGLAILLDGTSRFLYYLVTKRRSRDKPTYKDFWCSLKMMRDHIKQNKVKKLAIPRLGCGLDRLDWSTVKHIMEFLFKDVQLEIVACNFQPTEDAAQKYYGVNIHNNRVKLVNAKEPVLVYFTSMDSHVSDEMKDLNEKYKFLEDFEKTPKNFGVVVQKQTDECVLCGCVVRKNVNAPFDFRSFSRGLSEISKLVKDRGYTSIALQCLKDDSDDLLHQKIITVIINYLNDVDVYVCSGQIMDVSFDET